MASPCVFFRARARVKISARARLCVCEASSADRAGKWVTASLLTRRKENSKRSTRELTIKNFSAAAFFDCGSFFLLEKMPRSFIQLCSADFFLSAVRRCTLCFEIRRFLTGNCGVDGVGGSGAAG